MKGGQHKNDVTYPFLFGRRFYFFVFRFRTLASKNLRRWNGFTGGTSTGSGFNWIANLFVPKKLDCLHVVQNCIYLYNGLAFWYDGCCVNLTRWQVWGGLDGVDTDVQVRLQCQSGEVQEHIAQRVSERELIQ